MLKFDLARNALRYIVKRDGIKEIYIPYYLCDVIRHTLFEEHCQMLFYHIDDNLMPAQNFPIESYILYPNYFGICSKNVERLINLYPHLIVDNAHAFYAQPSGYTSFNSSRKFLPENEGAFLWFGEGINPAKPNLTRQEEFFRIHKEFKEHNLLNIDIKQNDIPFCYPLLANTPEEADNIAKNLQKEGKTIYRYWNNLPKSFNEYKFYSRLVPIPL